MLIYSLEERRVDLLTISSTRNKTELQEDKIKGLFPENKSRAHNFINKKYVVLTCRVHPGEVPGSHVLNGILDYLSEFNSNNQVKILMDNFVFVIVPMLNPDGVYKGHYRVDTLGQNLNRFYQNPNIQDQPSVYAVKEYFLYLHKTKHLYFYMDLHAHAGKKGIFSFGNNLNYRSHIDTLLFNKILSINNPDYDYDNCNFTEKNMYSKDKSDMLSKEGAGRVALHK